MMRINIREDQVEIEGYVNSIERRSKPLMSRIGKFIERICKGAFKKAIERNDNVRILLNHNWEKDLGGTKDGNLELHEDNIGLHARATITDKEVIEKAREGSLVGWSFGFKDREVENSVEHGIPTRDVKDLDLYEVSILDRTKSPAYEGTLISVRSEEDYQYHGEPFLDPAPSVQIEKREQIDNQCECPHSRSNQAGDRSSAGVAGSDPLRGLVDYSEYENLLKEMKGEL